MWLTKGHIWKLNFHKPGHNQVIIIIDANSDHFVNKNMVPVFMNNGVLKINREGQTAGLRHLTKIDKSI